MIPVGVKDTQRTGFGQATNQECQEARPLSGDVRHASDTTSSRSIHLNVVLPQVWSLRVGEIRVLQGVGSGDALSGVESKKALQEVDC